MTLKCDICDYRCSVKGILTQLVSSVHEKKKPCKYDICDYSCSIKSNLTGHIRTVHEEKKLFNCELCAQKQNMKVHYAQVHSL